MAAENERVSLKEKGMVLYACLTLSGVTIEEAAEHFLDDYDETADQRVSQILKSYGFNEKSLGRFAKLYSFAFKRSAFSELDINLFKQQDTAAFVGENPKGGTNPEDMERFLRARINERLHQQRSGQSVLPPKQQENQEPEEPRRIISQSVLSQQTAMTAYTASDSVKNTPDKEKTDKISANSGNAGSSSDKADNNKQKAQSNNSSKKKWGGIIGAVIGILAVVFIFNAACGGTGISCVSSSGRTGCVSSKSINVEITVGYISNGSFENPSLVVDDKYRTHLEVSSSNKFTASMGSGKHTVRVEYYKDGTLCSSDSLEITVTAADNHFNVLAFPNKEKVVLMLAN